MSALRKAKWSFTSPKDRHFLCISHRWLHVETQLLELPPRDACLLENGKTISDWAVHHRKEPGSTGLKQVLDPGQQSLILYQEPLMLPGLSCNSGAVFLSFSLSFFPLNRCMLSKHSFVSVFHPPALPPGTDRSWILSKVAAGVTACLLHTQERGF